MHNNSNMIIHILGNITQKASREDRHPTEPNTRIINPLVALRIRDPPGRHNSIIRSLVPRNPGDLAEAVEQRGAGELDCFGDERGICDVELGARELADVVFCVGLELGDEDVVVDCVAD